MFVTFNQFFKFLNPYLKTSVSIPGLNIYGKENFNAVSTNSRKTKSVMEPNSEDSLNKKAQSILRALNHPARRQILQVLHQYGKMTMDEICKQLDIENFLATRHLAILQDTEFVKKEENGSVYTVNYDRVKEAHSINKQLRQ